MKLIVGLGNPGKEYARSRHNAGFMAVDKMGGCFDFEPFAFEKKFNALLTCGNINGERTILLKPQTFMNSSGSSVKAVIDYYKISFNDLIVIQDELDISAGEFKISRDRSAAGHKGIQSIIDAIGTKDFTRYRIGIDSDRHNIAPDKFVLENFTQEESGLVSDVIGKICDNIKERA